MTSHCRLACFGDSWIGTWADHPTEWKIETPLPLGLRHELNERGCSGVEMCIAPFGGASARRLLQLTQVCRLRDLALFTDRHGWLPQQGNIAEVMERAGVPMRAGSVAEDVDIVLVIAGYNDLKRGASALDVVQTLLELEKVFKTRGVEMILVTMGRGHAHLEEERLRANASCMQRCACVIDCDRLLERLGPSAWENHDHLTSDGYVALGRLLAAELVDHLKLDGNKLLVCDAISSA